jgi:hypothetical protein
MNLAKNLNLEYGPQIWKSRYGLRKIRVCSLRGEYLGERIIVVIGGSDLSILIPSTQNLPQLQLFSRKVGVFISPTFQEADEIKTNNVEFDSNFLFFCKSANVAEKVKNLIPRLLKFKKFKLWIESVENTLNIKIFGTFRHPKLTEEEIREIMEIGIGIVKEVR